MNMSVTNASLQAALDANDPRTCKKAWCVKGRYTPPQCVNNPHCRDIQLFRPDWVQAQFEAMVTNLGLNFTIIYLGNTQAGKMADAAMNQTPALWYSYIPTKDVSQLDLTPVTWPAHNDAQFSSHPGTVVGSKIASEMPLQTVKKLVSKRFKDRAPDAFELVQRLQISNSQIKELLAALPHISQKIPTTSKELFNAACGWLRNNTATWQNWRPTTYRCPAGSAYNATVHICKKCEGNTVALKDGLVACTGCEFISKYGSSQHPLTLKSANPSSHLGGQ
jgi:hypothetical protein